MIELSLLSSKVSSDWDGAPTRARAHAETPTFCVFTCRGCVMSGSTHGSVYTWAGLAQPNLAPRAVPAARDPNPATTANPQRNSRRARLWIIA